MIIVISIIFIIIIMIIIIIIFLFTIIIIIITTAITITAFRIVILTIELTFPLLGTISRRTLTEIRVLNFFIRFIPAICFLETFLLIGFYQKFVF